MLETRVLHACASGGSHCWPHHTLLLETTYLNVADFSTIPTLCVVFVVLLLSELFPKSLATFDALSVKYSIGSHIDHSFSLSITIVQPSLIPIVIQASIMTFIIVGVEHLVVYS